MLFKDVSLIGFSVHGVLRATNTDVGTTVMYELLIQKQIYTTKVAVLLPYTLFRLKTVFTM